ncbi:bifunctional glycosyltransferase family 2 protein/CDP-glycerol:glycerophosphate glycerophosphotransferase [Bacillus sp. FJAT-49736]|uniref:bifunctional glycosyltransferase/CDP-glycerol:glycerophosphate glycerophosphotransferase n=1 Tax=Bacillus sp. FJAT-49736 TaxID=2833582 RepID=UPI001BC8CAD5|nr:bifunctional glycosyltransferase family 2 protein/CDP-glycerol:glycerophosphate glycerophosphotransferase [Bacillus sp. FJAT-49736]MBS4174056.1 bifunctional glycosyltransferase family 2 protein/CDP-glycerol:glycerophosphate glycerophosphotransferase [Bacillus sp. FJAT-49736]
MKISVIIPVYNTEEFLPECMESVVNQTYKDMEILIINDGSTDYSYKILKEYENKDNRIKLFSFKERKGVGAARNFGISQSTGEYLYFLDSDDYLEISALEKLINNIKSGNILSGQWKVMKKKGDIDEIEIEESAIIYRGALQHFKRRSIIHHLISSEWIKSNNLRFSEDVNCYSELPFIVSLLKLTSEVPRLTDCLYFKRLRNDPISNPAVMQASREQKLLDLLSIYNDLKGKENRNLLVEDYLDLQFLNFYRKNVVMLFADSSNINDYFHLLIATAKKVSKHILKTMNIVVRNEIKLLAKGKKQSYSRLIAFHHFARNLKRALTGRTKMYYYLYNSIFLKLPLKEKTIIFESFLGKNYSDSPKYIYEYMQAQNMDYKYIWIFNKKVKDIPGNPKQIKRFSLAYYYYLATAKYWVSNSRMPLHLKKREGNIYLQTWHGTPLKKLVFDMNDIYSANPKYKKHFYQQSRRWDYLISPNQYSTEIFKRAFKYDKAVLEYGYPRNDILYHIDRDNIANRIKQKLNIPLDKKVILYAPTWRDDEFYEPGKYKFNIKLNLQEMKEQLGDQYVILLRMHYFIADDIDTAGMEGFAYNLSKYDDIAELYLISDILITDYSSVFFDYANLKRPILFYTYDLEKYRDTLRGFYINIESDVPGPLLYTTGEIIDSVRNIEQISEKYKDRYDEFYQTYCDWDNGEAAAKVVRQVFSDDTNHYYYQEKGSSFNQ